MKKSIFTNLVALIITVGFSIIYSGCNKTTSTIDPEDKPVESSTGEATVGEAGGTIKVGDESSPIYGANIEIPANALDKEVNIKIVTGEKVEINGTMIQTVEFQPDGQEFKEQVVIGVPWTTDNQDASNTRIYYYDSKNTEIVQLVNDHVDAQNKITYAYVSHFSSYFNNPQYYWIESKLMKRGDVFYANMYMHTPMMYIKPLDASSFYENAQDIILENEGEDNCFVRLRFNLLYKHRIHKDYIQGVAAQDFFIKYKKNNGSWDIWIYRYDNPSITSNHPEEVFHKTGMSFEQMTGDWFTGSPVTASFNDQCFWDPFYPYDDDMLEVSCSWALVKTFTPLSRDDYWVRAKGIFSGLTVNRNLASYSGDYNNNNIEDSFENGNNAPAKPSDPQPADGAVDVETNTSLQWSCIDTDGDNLTYKIYLGEDYNTTLIGTTDNTTNFTPSELANSTTYYWYVEAIDPSGAKATSDTWEFTTKAGGGGGGTGCGGVTSVEYGGQTYHTVEIGNQCWLKENLNVGTMINGTVNQSNNGVVEKYCYQDNEDNCNSYGGLYKWNELMNYTANEGAKGICPDGWHIPSDAEWKTLEGNADSQYGVGDGQWDYGGWRGYDAGKKLKSATGWFMNNNGTDEFGFAALPGGYRNGNSGSYTDKSVGGWFWTSSFGRVHGFAYNYDKVYSSSHSYEDAIPVRCVKD